MISGINHITLSVRNLEESFAFYRDILGCQPLCRWPKGAYFQAGEVWLALVVDEEARSEPLEEYTHIAFSISSENFPKMREKIETSGAEIWQENWTEGESLYFVDPNGHKLEIHLSDLASRLKAARRDPWEGLEFF